MENRSVYRQIASKMAPAIAHLNQTFDVSPPHAPRSVFYADKTAEYMRKNPEAVPASLLDYEDLTNAYNMLAMTNSPLMALFPHSFHMREVLMQNTSVQMLPTLRDMGEHPEWKHILKQGIADMSAYVELGNCMDIEGTQSFLKGRPGNQIVTPAQADLDEPTRLAAIQGHAVERIYLAWLAGLGYTGVKDEVLGVYDEMIQYRNLIGKPSPLEETYKKLRWVKNEKLEALRRQFELETDMLPGAIPATLPFDTPKDTVVTEHTSLNIYEDPNPLLNHLLARKTGAVSERLAAQKGVDFHMPFSAILDTGSGISTVSFGEWRRSKGKIKRTCEIRTRDAEGAATLDHMTVTGTELSDGSISYSMDRSDYFCIDYGTVSVQAMENWTRTFAYTENEGDFNNRKSLPRMIRDVLSRTDGKLVDYFAMKYPDESPRTIACQYLGRTDLVVDEQNDTVLVPVQQRSGMNLREDEAVMKKQILSDIIAQARAQCDPAHNFAVCDEVYKAKYGKDA